MTFEEWQAEHSKKRLSGHTDHVALAILGHAKAAWDAAILAERVRCAGVANAIANEEQPPGTCDHIQVGRWSAADKIADEIRSGGVGQGQGWKMPVDEFVAAMKRAGGSDGT